MNVIARVIVGGITGWLTGKLVEIEGRDRVVGEGHVLDMIYGIVGGMAGEYLFFWIVIGKGNGFSDFATTVLGSITLVGVARWLVARWRLARPYKNNTLPGTVGVARVNPEGIDRSEALVTP